MMRGGQSGEGREGMEGLGLTQRGLGMSDAGEADEAIAPALGATAGLALLAEWPCAGAAARREKAVAVTVEGLGRWGVRGAGLEPAPAGEERRSISALTMPAWRDWTAAKILFTVWSFASALPSSMNAARGSYTGRGAHGHRHEGHVSESNKLAARAGHARWQTQEWRSRCECRGFTWWA